MKLKIYSFVILIFFLFTDLKAQDYLISFAGTGESTTVTSVTVENLTQAKSLQMDGGMVLRLMGVVTGLEDPGVKGDNKIIFFPNPSAGYSRMKFIQPVSGETNITVFDLSGRQIYNRKEDLQIGEHTFGIRGMGDGMYIVRIGSGSYLISGLLVSSGSPNKDPEIVREFTETSFEKKASSKDEAEEVKMQYTSGDVLKFTGISGNYTTIITDVPATSKTITFNFVECTDGDGNDYPVVETGKGEEKCIQYWMAVNLRSTKYSDQTSVPLVTNGAAWSAMPSDAYCWYNNNETAYKSIYGALYNWYAVNTGKLCPTGWHMPTDEEWKALADHFGGLGYTGGRMKETGTTHWTAPNTGATNISGFTALPGGYRTENGSFVSMGNKGMWWSDTDYDASSAWFRSMTYDSDIMIRDHSGQKNGFSVRCVKDY